MTSFVLVHGAFRGGWSWDRVRPLLAPPATTSTRRAFGCGELAPYAAR